MYVNPCRSIRPHTHLGLFHNRTYRRRPSAADMLSLFRGWLYLRLLVNEAETRSPSWLSPWSCI